MGIFMKRDQSSIGYGSSSSSSHSSSTSSEVKMNVQEDLTLSLPDELLERIMVLLPISYVLRARTVCTRWNTISSSTWFLRSYRENNTPSAPWYFMFKEPHHSHGSFYDPASKKWYTSSLPFTKMSSSWLNIVASSHGLACFADNNVVDMNNGYGLYVCNPMTRYWRSIPPVPSRKYWCDDSTIYYAVSMTVDKITGDQTMVVARSNRIPVDNYLHNWSLNIEVWSSASQSWQTLASTILDDGWRGGENSVICNDIFYCVIHLTTMQLQVPHRRHALMLCELATGKLTTPFVLMPTSLTCVRLINCKEKLIMVGGIGESDIVTGIGVWELDAEWKEVSVMPDKFFKLFSEFDDVFSCSGAGELIYIHGYGSPQLLLFSLRNRSWHWSHRCPLMKRHPLHIFTGFCFEPRLDPCI